MTTEEFIDSIDVVSQKVKDQLKEGFVEELENELTDEVRMWILERVEDIYQEWIFNN